MDLCVARRLLRCLFFWSSLVFLVMVEKEDEGAKEAHLVVLE